MRRLGAFCLLAVIGLVSCNTINYMAIETYNPAEITFPGRIEKILIVNNAVPQPEQSVCTFTLLGVVQDTCKVNVDSALVYACRGLGNSILEGEYFYDVLLYNEPLRSDNSFLAEQKLSPEKVNDLCLETNTDAIISLEKLLFVVNKDIKKIAEGYIEGNIRIDVGGVFRTYLPNRTNSLATVQMNDSLFWSEFALDTKALDFYLPLLEDAVKFTGSYFGSKIYPNFVPHWQNETRWYYTGIGANWKRASAYARAGKWDEAADLWKQIHQKAGNWETKARSAANIALASEMSGKFDEAVEWVGKASTLWDANAAEDDRDRQLIDLYKEALGDRIRLNRKLDQQIGAE